MRQLSSILLSLILATVLAMTTLANVADSATDEESGWQEPAQMVVVDRRTEPTYQAVYGFAQDAQGFVWLATRAGPVRFNGRYYEAYATLAEQSLVTDSSPDIAAHPDHGVWIAAGTLRHLDPWSGTSYDHNIRVERLAAEGRRLWTWHEGTFSLLEADDDGIEPIMSVPYPHSVGVGELVLVAKNDLLHVGDASGLTTIDTDGNIQSFTIPSGVTGMTARAAGGLWLLSQSGLWVFDGERRPERLAALPRRNGSFSRLPTAGVVERSDGTVWVGYLSGRVDRFEPDAERWVEATQLPASTGEVTAAFEDDFGGLWIGRAGEQVNRLGRNRFIDDILPPPSGANETTYPNLTSIAFDRHGNLLATTSGDGTHSYNKSIRTWTQLGHLDLSTQHETGEAPPEVTGFASTRRFDWLATWGAGLHRIDPVSKRVDALPLKDSAYITKIVADDYNRVWIANPGFGIQAVSESGRPLYHFGPPSVPTIANLRVNTIWPERERVLIGGDAGLEIINLADGRVERFSSENAGLVGRSVKSIFVDPDGAIWMTTNAGLERLAPGENTSVVSEAFQVAAPGSAEVLVAIDEGRKLWVGADEVIALVDTATSELIATFDSSDGLPLGANLSQAVTRAEDDSVYIAINDGIVQLTPDPEHEKHPFGSSLYARCVLGCSLDANGDLVVSPSGVRFEFDVTGQLAGSDFRIEYRLEGAEDKSRVSPIGESTVVYQHLSPGDYHLRASIIDSHNHRVAEVITAGPTALAFSIDQPWWRSDRGRLLMVGAVLAIGVAWLVLNQQADRRQRLRLEAIVSERTRALDQARHDAEQALAARSKLMSQVSHELRSPLTSIGGGAELLLLSDLDDVQRRQTNTILTSTKHLASLIDDLLEVGLRDGSAFSTRLGSVDVSAVVESVVEGAKSTAARQNIELQCTIDPAICGRYITDGKRLRQVLSNLVNNAISHAGASVISVSVERVGDHGDQLPKPLFETLMFEVWDDAGTFEADQLSRLSEPFERGTKDANGGLGLGLSIVTGILRRFGSDLKVEVKPDRWTSFHFELAMQHPIRESLKDHDQSPSDRDGGRTRPLRALVVDDEPMVRQVLVQMLAHLDWSAVEAATGEDALLLAGEFDFDLILTDLMMAPMPGVELATRLRKQGRAPIVAVTGAAVDDQEHFDAVLNKPIGLADLELVIRSLNIGSEDSKPPTMRAETVT